MDALWSSALQLGIGGLCVAGIIYTSLEQSKSIRKMQEEFMKALDTRADKHEAALKEREHALRSVETSVRNNFTEIITKNTIALVDVARIMSRLDKNS